MERILMMNRNYKSAQIPIDAYDLLKEYCKLQNHHMGRFIADLIKERCTVPKPIEGKILRVETKKGS